MNTKLFHCPFGRPFACPLTLAVSAALLSGAARAQVDAAEAPGLPGTEAPVLTPTRMRQALRDIPAAITILPAELVATYGFLGISEAIRLVAGTSPNRLNGANYDLRLGGKPTTSPSRVTVLVDGIEVGSNVLSDDDDWTELPVAIDDVERIEVTRGAGAAGFGRASKVVVINIVTKHPADVERGYARLVGGSYSTFRALARGGWTFGPAALRVTLHHRERGELDDARAGNLGSDSVVVDRLTVRSSILFEEGSELALDAAYLSSHHDGFPAAQSPLARLETTNGYASLKWTRSLSAANELSVRLDHWGSNGDQFDPECGSKKKADACSTFVGVERRVRLDLQDVHVFADGLRVAGGVGLREAMTRSEDGKTAHWSARYRRAFAGVDWQPVPDWSLSAGGSADEADSANHDRTLRAGANWRLGDDQTLRIGWSGSDWASDQSLRMDIPGNLLTQERMQSTELGYLFDNPAAGTSIDGRIFWSRMKGVVFNQKKDQPAHGEFYGAEMRAAGELSARFAGFVSVTVTTQGSSTSDDDGHRPRPWGGAAGLTVNLDGDWRASIAYYGSSNASTSTQTAGRADITILKDFRVGDARWRAGLNLRHVDHIRRTALDGKTPLTKNDTSQSFYASLAAAF